MLNGQHELDSFVLSTIENMIYQKPVLCKSQGGTLIFGKLQDRNSGTFFISFFSRTMSNLLFYTATVLHSHSGERRF